MLLYIMRHGPAEDHAKSGRDADRALTSPGAERVRDVARALDEGGEAPDLIFTSPLARAQQTAEIVASVTKLEERGAKVEIARELAPDGNASDLVQRAIDEGHSRVMVVGHEPDLTDLAEHLSGRRFPGGLQKAMVVGLATPLEGPMHLRFVLDPKSLEWLHDAR